MQHALRNTVFSVCVLFLFGQVNKAWAQDAVLATGKWYKIGVTQSGIHKLTAADLEKAGVPMAGVNPQNLRLYGNGGAMLPQPNATPRPQDLTENAIFVSGEADAQWNASDYLLFCAQGPHLTQYDRASRQFSHQINLYSDTAFYFLTLGSLPGKRVASSIPVTGATQDIQTYDDYTFHEKDQHSLVQSGREWWGEKLEILTEQTFPFTIPGLVTTQPTRMTASVLAQSANTSQFAVQVNGQAVGSISVGNIGSGLYDIKGATAVQSFSFTPSSTTLDVKLIHQRSSGVGYINWLGIQYKRTLKLYGDQTRFQAIESMDHDKVRYLVQEAGADAEVWEISSFATPVRQSVTGSDTRVFEATGRQWKEFVVFKPTAALRSPVRIQLIENQNIHALSTPQLLIVTHPNFLTQAQQLAAFRNSHDGLQVAVLTTSQIYNEFSSGQQDVTAIRDCIRFLYQKSSALQYVLLIGDASYDYKNRLPNNTNFVPVYESYQSLHPIFSYSSDDYFGFMEEREGAWDETAAGDHTLEIGIGRLPVRNAQEATVAINKLIRYAQTPETLGDWRQQVTFVADDGDGNTHQLDADRLAGMIQDSYPGYQTKKIFLDAFPQTSFANGQISLKAVEAINQSIDRGCLIMNYTGHGSELGWAQEQLLTVSQLRSWHNTYRMPLLVTATCEFGRYDDPEHLSGAELALQNPLGGAIGLLTTTRPVFSSSNYAVNVAFYNSVFMPVNDEMPRLGDIMKKTKNNSLSGSINRNFALLGDPSLRLAYPKKSIVITKINNKVLTSQKDTLRALGHVTLEGEIRDASGVVLSDFNGSVQVTVFDKPRNSTTLGTESVRMNFLEQNTLLFKGMRTVRNGRFVAEWIMPKDITYVLGQGMIRMYAQSITTQGDASGAELVWIGGSEAAPVPDNKSPEVQLYMNDTTFVSGGTTATNPVFLARLNDVSGITLSNAGIGHEITAVLDDSVTVVLTDFYQASTDTYQKGEIRYPFKDLALGLHHIQLYVWDTYNNPVKATLEFTVVKDPLQLSMIQNYPNPVTSETVFTFAHNRGGEELDIKIDIQNMLGQRIHTIHMSGVSSQHISIPWNMSASGSLLPEGMYVYQVRVQYLNETAVGVGKLVVRRE